MDYRSCELISYSRELVDVTFDSSYFAISHWISVGKLDILPGCGKKKSLTILGQK